MQVLAPLYQTGRSCCVLRAWTLPAGGEPTGSPSEPATVPVKPQRALCDSRGQFWRAPPDTMPASIYPYQAETEVFRSVGGEAGRTERTDAEWLFVCSDRP